MVTVRPAADRGVTHLGWLDSRHSFSFGDYFDPARQNYHALRVLNDDRVTPAAGFGTHPHRDMEILTAVLSGELTHRDSMGNGSVVTAGEWQLMSAGSGVRHSEENPSATHPVHFLQMWVVPGVKGAPPRYAQTRPAGDGWQRVAGPDGSGAPLPLRQDVRVWTLAVAPGGTATLPLAAGRAGYLHLATGTATVNGVALTAGDAVTVEGEPAVALTGTAPGVAVLFDLG